MDIKSIVIEAVADIAGLELTNTAIIEIANIVEENFTSTNTGSPKSCATCQYEGYDWGVCHDCCYKCLSEYAPRKTSCVG
jgi:hypothetical protein